MFLKTYFYFADKHKDNTVGAAKPQADAKLMSASSEHSSALPDFASFTNANAKEKAFISYLEPLISANNKQILADRERLKSLLKKQSTQWSQAEKQFLVSLSKSYGLADITQSTDVAVAGQQLLNRVDAMPMSLPLAQAAIESAWGTSRFAREGNNLFGQWCWTPGCGIEPKEMGAKYHAVERFDSVYDSVAAYLMNINTQQAYADLRKARASMRATGVALNGYQLANYLQNYSQIGEKYVEEIHEIMQHNKLSDLGTEMTAPTS